MLKNPLTAKILMLGILALLLLIPLGMIQSKISERQFLQKQVQQDIARSSSGPQTLEGPSLVIKYKLRERYTSKDKDGNERTTVTESVLQEMIIPANKLVIDGDADVETRSRGIYKANLFNLHAKLSGDMLVPKAYGLNKAADDIIPVSAYFVLNMSDARGIHNVPALTLNGNTLAFEPGTVSPLGGNGMHVKLKKFDAGEAHALKFDFPLELQGMDSLAILPTGNHTEMSLKSSWPHPSFGGGYLPQTRSINDNGFSAQWLVSNLARNSNTQDTHTSQAAETFSVGFIDPVNIYLLSERAVKYGILFVVLIFTAFFIFEILQGMRIHPMQYLLVGMAMAVFFLLLISLSEHLAFLAAYLLAGTACVALTGAYLIGVLKKRKPAYSFTAGIALLYAVLYGVLQSEDNALLMGSLIMFSALAAVMLLTRNMNWYELNHSAASS
ncbi:MAG: cell envelope integrity protein CreD [Gallionellaceae bacterium]|jgi:inner membrane protein